MYYRYKNLRLCRRIRDLGHSSLHLLPTRKSQRLPQATFRHLPMWLGGRDLTLPCFRQTKDAFTSVLSRPDVDPTLPPQQGQSAGERCAVHGKAGTQRLLVRLANNAEGGQQAKLGDFDVGLAEFLVVDPRDESCETAKILTSAKEWKKCICAMNVVNWPTHNSMYIHLILRGVKERGRLIFYGGYARPTRTCSDAFARPVTKGKQSQRRSYVRYARPQKRSARVVG